MTSQSDRNFAGCISLNHHNTGYEMVTPLLLQVYGAALGCVMTCGVHSRLRLLHEATVSKRIRDPFPISPACWRDRKTVERAGSDHRDESLRS